jgi:transcription initiation factor TFIIIB Brf1 subunit/transcription initiation factor TFIIB
MSISNQTKYRSPDSVSSLASLNLRSSPSPNSPRSSVASSSTDYLTDNFRPESALSNPISSNELDTLSGPDINIDLKDDKEEDCLHKNLNEDGPIKICEDCGEEVYQEISYEQDWRYFGNDDRQATDPTRVQYRKTADKGIRKYLERLGISADIAELADKIYTEVTNGRIKRNELRKQISFGCTFEAYRIKGKPRSPEGLQKKFGLDWKGSSQGITWVRVRMSKDLRTQANQLTPEHIIPDLMKKLNCTQEHIDMVVSLYNKLGNGSSILRRSNPPSISIAIVYYYLRRKGTDIELEVYSRIMELSHTIVLRLAEEISRLLGTSDNVSLN